MERKKTVVVIGLGRIQEEFGVGRKTLNQLEAAGAPIFRIGFRRAVHRSEFSDYLRTRVFTKRISS